MKKLIQSILFITVIILQFSSCLKDVGTKQYKVYTPIIESMSSLKAKVKSTSPISVTNAGKLFVIGNYVLLNEREKGIHVIDNANPSNPINKAFIVIPGNTDLFVKGNTLYANCYTDLLAIDISNYTAINTTNSINDIFSDIRFINGYSTSTGNAIVGWSVRDTFLHVDIAEGQGIWNNGKYISSSWPGGGIFSLGGGATPASSATGKAGSMSRFAVVNNYLYAVSNSKLFSVDVSNTAQPVVVSNKNIGWNIETIYPFKDKLFIGSQTGMSIFSLTNAAQPTYISGFDHARLCDPVIADDNYAYLTLHSSADVCVGTQNELNVLKISNILSPVLVKRINLTKPKGLSKDGNLLLVCDDDAGIKVFDVTNPENPILKQTIVLAASYDVICNNGIALVSAKDGLHQYNYSNPNAVVKLSSFVY